ncbi:MAG: hypothetical protein NVSMB7_12080 [Chitinophagaceae bacterium]
MKQTAHKHVSPSALFIKKSKLPCTGKGLFTREGIAKGQFIVEYKGRITTWKTITDSEVFNAYVYYVNRNHVVDAMHDLTALGRYANDADGLIKMPGINNNAQYATRNKKVFIQAITDIAAGDEIFVAYGKEYWDVIKYNQALEPENKKKKK